eukprot:SAG31_NODE_118_length_24006_cov_8.219266_6_plen_174_part_00
MWILTVLATPAFRGSIQASPAYPYRLGPRTGLAERTPWHGPSDAAGAGTGAGAFAGISAARRCRRRRRRRRRRAVRAAAGRAQPAWASGRREAASVRAPPAGAPSAPFPASLVSTRVAAPPSRRAPDHRPLTRSVCAPAFLRRVLLSNRTRTLPAGRWPSGGQLATAAILHHK